MKRIALLVVFAAGCTLSTPSLAPCTDDSACNGEVCLAGKCRPAGCADGRVNGRETDLDCGGAFCAPCAVSRVCLDSNDCDSKLCTLNVCAAATCTDGLRNGAETDLDCGGPVCPKCEITKACTVPTDCLDGACTNNVCGAPTCSDGTRGGTETDVDCGGTCGKCDDGKSCAKNVDCKSGSCADGKCGNPCAAPLLACNGACVDRLVDRMNCGGCGTACQAGAVCAGGTCQLQCLGDTLSCGNACVDPLSNPMHCGGCGNACGAGQICIGMCIDACPIGQVPCNGTCVSLDRDRANCGLCGRSCSAGSACVMGNCSAGCGAPLTVCDGGFGCADTRNDPMNCGGCGIACQGFPQAPFVCSNSTCAPLGCVPGFADCDLELDPNGCEAFLPADPLNCGACGRMCPFQSQCTNGQCCDGMDLPPGTYQTTCMNCLKCDGTLSCTCKNAAQIPIQTSIPLTPPCGPPGYSNCNGQLTCGMCP